MAMETEVTDVVARDPDAGDAREVNVLGEPIARQPNGRWLPGTRVQPLGRIKKAPTVLSELEKQAHQAKHRRKIAAAWVQATEDPHSAVAQRAREALTDRLYGLPKATLVLQQGESQADALDAELAAYLAAKTVDGTARVIDSD